MTYALSIITTTYNHGGFIQDTMRSVLSQTFLKTIEDRSIQWIIVEDGSEDDTFFCIEKLLSQSDLSKFDVTLLRHYTNLGAYQSFIDAFNLKPSGVFWTILEGDDMWKPEFLMRTWTTLSSMPNWMGVHTDTDYLYGSTLQKDHWKTQGRFDNYGNHYPNIPSGNIYKELLKNNFIMTCAAMFRKGALVHNNLEKFRAKKYLMSDYPFFLALARNSEIGYIDESLAIYRQHDKGVSNDPAKRQEIVDSTLRVQEDAKKGLI